MQSLAQTVAPPMNCLSIQVDLTLGRLRNCKRLSLNVKSLHRPNTEALTNESEV